MEQINNQIQQLQNEADMLINRARNPANLDFNIVNRLRSTLATTERLIAEAQGLAYDVQNLDSDFARLYPEQYAATISGDQMFRDARERWKNSLDGLHTAMRMQAQVSQNGARRRRAGRPREPEPVGHRRAASHAGDEPASRLAGQAVHPAQQLQITQDRAASLELARQAAATERAREVRRRFRHRHAVHAAVRQLLQQLTGAAMRCVPVLLAVLLTACGQQPAEDCRDLGRRSRAAQGAACPMRSRPARRRRRHLPRRRRSLPAAVLRRPDRAGRIRLAGRPAADPGQLR